MSPRPGTGKSRGLSAPARQHECVELSNPFLRRKVHTDVLIYAELDALGPHPLDGSGHGASLSVWCMRFNG